MNRKYCIFVILMVLILSLTTVYGSTFSDIKGHWAEKVVEEMATKGILNGFEDGTFKPNQSVTREQFAKILVESLEIEEKNRNMVFEDVADNRWSKEYINIASEYLTGYYQNGKYYFKPTESSVREDVAVAVVMASGLQDNIPNYDLLNQFSDKDKISENLRKYVAIAVENGIMQGKGGYFDPKGNLTRAEVSQLLFNVYEKVAINDISGKNIYGDVNGDGKITNNDYRKVLNCARGTSNLTNEKQKNADVDLDGKITENDAWLILVATKEDIKLPHECAGYTGEYEELNEKRHRVIEKCMCGEISYEFKESHDYEDGKCICGTEEPIHECEEEKREYEKIDNTNHKVVVKCECKKVLSETTEAHKFENGKCKCGAEKIFYGDVNGDNAIDGNDVSVLERYISKNYSSNINLANSDVNVDGKINEMDSIILRGCLGKRVINSLPHKCTKYTKEYRKIDSEKHDVILICECNIEYNIKNTEEHKFENGKCICGETTVLYGDADDNGVINLEDATRIWGYSSSKDPFNFENADVNLDGKIDDFDYIYILNHVHHDWKLPHTCGKYYTRMETGDTENHATILSCDCYEKLLTAREEHEYVDGKCICGSKIIYGDVNNDGIVDLEDSRLLDKHIEGEDVDINELAADMFLDEDLDIFDYNLLEIYRNGKYEGELPHMCGGYKSKVREEDDDEEEHRVRYSCDCNEIVFNESEEHEFEDGECECGYKNSDAIDTVVDTWEEAANELIELGILNSFSDGKYYPDKFVTRAEFAKILVLSTGFEAYADISRGETGFTDVASNHWASGYVNVVTEYGYMSGYPDGTFNPDATITYSEAITYAVRTLRYKSVVESKGGTWPTNYITKARELKMLDNMDYDTYNDNLTRGNMAILIWNMINTKTWNGTKTLLEIHFN